MHMLYDTRTVHPLERYDYYRAGAAGELAPVAVYGRRPGHLFAAMSVAQIGDFTLETVTWAADSDVVARRTDRLIRVADPECYRVFLSLHAGVRMEQAGHRVSFGARDIGLYDLSRPWETSHRTGLEPWRVVMLTFPRALVPIDRARLRPVVGTVMPRRLPGRSLVAQFLIEVADAPGTDGSGLADDADLADVLHGCAVGLLRQRLGLPTGITPRTRRLLYMVRVRAIIRRHLGDPTLDPELIARAAHISPRYLHALFADTGTTPMQLLKRIRLEECRRRLEDPAQGEKSIKEIISACGYRRPDQFARDFRQRYGVRAGQVRKPVGEPARG